MMDDLLTDFLTETSESLAELDVALLRLERNPGDEETLGLIFRLVHTIKGTCGFLGLPRLERVTHAAENVLGRLRDRRLAVNAEIVTSVLAAVDAVRRIVAALETTAAEPVGDDEPLIAALDAIFEGRAVTYAPPVPTAADPAAPDRGGPAQTIRVGVDLLEDLMALVSELVLTRNQLLQLARTQGNLGLTVPLQRLSLITSDLQGGVMKTRMQPIGNAWSKLPRLVRDLAREMGKTIELTMHGADTELDRQVLEMIKDPLTHMVRNSADHGLETGAERRAAGKPEAGRITLNAFHESGHIVVEIADDGRGLPSAMIRAKALSRGLATEAELAAMSADLIQRFIFQPGFSTAAAVTAVSGRGVGMDVVRENVERIGGTIDLRSAEGEGTTFTIKFPLTLAIVSALIVEAGGERFAVPQPSVIELVRADTAQSSNGAGITIERLGGIPVLRLRDKLLPLVSLAGVLELGDGTIAADSTIIVAQVGPQRLGIAVDRVFDTEEIVVKPVAPILRHMTMFSGNTILGDGSVIMILDPNGIARLAGMAAGAAERDGAGGRTPQEPALQEHTADRTALLLFRVGDRPMAMRLALVGRLENVARERIEWADGRAVTQFGGRLMPLVPVSGALDEDRPSHPVIVFGGGESVAGQERRIGLVVDQIIDVVEDHLSIQMASATPGLLGTAVIAGVATEIIDTGFWSTQVFGASVSPERAAAPRIAALAA